MSFGKKIFFEMCLIIAWATISGLKAKEKILFTANPNSH